MDVTPALLAQRACVQDGQLVRFYGRADTESGPLRVEDLLHLELAVSVTLGDGCVVPDAAAVVRVTGPWAYDGTVTAYEIDMVEDPDTLKKLRDRACLRLLEFQASCAYKLARVRTSSS